MLAIPKKRVKMRYFGVLNKMMTEYLIELRWEQVFHGNGQFYFSVSELKLSISTI